MRYIQGSEELGSQIMLVWRLPPDLLADFHALIQGGRVPKQAIVSFPSGALTFGWEPDGSGQNWDNEKTPAVPIESVTFNFDLEAPSIDRPWDMAIPDESDREFFSDQARVNFALLRKLSAIESSITRLAWTLGLIAVLVLLLVLRFCR